MVAMNVALEVFCSWPRQARTEHISKLIQLFHDCAEQEYLAVHNLRRANGFAHRGWLSPHRSLPLPANNGLRRWENARMYARGSHPCVIVCHNNASLFAAQDYERWLADNREWAQGNDCVLLEQQWPSWHSPEKTQLIELWSRTSWAIVEPLRAANRPQVLATQWPAIKTLIERSESLNDDHGL